MRSRFLFGKAEALKHLLMETGGMTVTYGDLEKGALADTVPYYVEREDGAGDFDFAQGELPVCTPRKSKGFFKSELLDIEELLRDNMPLVYDQLRGTGAWA